MPAVCISTSGLRSRLESPRLRNTPIIGDADDAWCGCGSDSLDFMCHPRCSSHVMYLLETRCITVMELTPRKV